VAAHLQTALDYANVWADKKVIASFADLLRTIQHMLANPVRVAAADAASAVTLVAHFSEAQLRLDALTEQYMDLIAALKDAWPDRWRGTIRETHIRQHTADFERILDSMQSSPDLTVDNLTEGNEFLANTISALEALLEDARERDPGSGSGDGTRPGRESPPPDKIEIALRYFGFSKATPPTSKQQLRNVWRDKFKKLHPDAHPGATEEKINCLTEQCQECDMYYRMLLAYFSWS
jgi:hypothetical protein